MTTENRIQNTEHAKTGTREWSDESYNFDKGCPNGCRYCYARWWAVCGPYKYMSPKDWLNPEIVEKKVKCKFKLYKNDDGSIATVMVPTTHDITEKNLVAAIKVIKRLLEAGNKLLIVSKPRWHCITKICDELRSKNADYTLQALKQIEFRFTIGSTSDNVLKFWEPNASTFAMRRACLQYAFNAGFKTSVSCEPMLDPYPGMVFDACRQYITESIWFGLLNKFDERVDLAGISEDQHIRFIGPLKYTFEKEFVKELYQRYKNEPLVRWKDSIRKVLATENTENTEE